jgi:hypothetical protein
MKTGCYPVQKTAAIYETVAKAKPNYVKPLFPNEPRLQSADLYKPPVLFFIYSVIVVVGGFSAFVAGFYNPGYFAIVALCAFAFLSGGKVLIETMFPFKQNIKNYKSVVLSNKENYKKSLENYKQVILPNYYYSLKKYEQDLSKINNKKILEVFRKKLLSDTLKQQTVPVKHSSSARMKKGVAENHVLTRLVARFPQKVFVDATVNNKGISARKNFLPDFIIHDSKVGYSVVIEIDEPYELECGYPIHYIAHNGKSIDDSRDQYFLDNNWSVLRFAEVQFVLYPDECCDFIANFINIITMNLASLPVSGLYDSLGYVKCWSEEEANEMEHSGFRESYLPGDILGNDMLSFEYKVNEHAIRMRRREQAVAAEIERERKRTELLKAEDEASRKYRYSSDENDLPF